MGVTENNLECSILSLGGKVDENAYIYIYIYIYVNLTCRKKKKHFLIICEMHAKFTPEDVFYVYIYIYIYIYEFLHF